MMRTEWAAGLVASVLANTNKGKNTPPFKITDFTPHINEPAISLDQAMQEWT
jgi:transcription elongation factor